MKRTTFSDFTKQWWVSVTNRCNWKCFYCDFPLKKTTTDATLETIEQFASDIKHVVHDNNIELFFEGGEIGLLDTKLLDAIFYSGIDDTYGVTTNGMFLENGFHIKYADKIHYILYHTHSDINDKSPKVKRYDIPCDIKVDYTIVIHKNNIKYLSKFFDDNKDCMFLPHLLQPRTPGLNFLTIDDFKEIEKILSEKENVRDFFVERVRTIIKHLEREKEDPSELADMRKTCAKIYYKPIIDLVTKRIKRCCITIDNCDSVDLNLDNLIRLDNNDLTMFGESEPICDNCIANFLWRHNKKYMFDNNRNEFFSILRKNKKKHG